MLGEEEWSTLNNDKHANPKHKHQLLLSEYLCAALTSELVQLSIDRVYDEHVRRLVAGSHRGPKQGQRPAWLLAPSLLVDKIVQLSRLCIQHKVPAQREDFTVRKVFTACTF